MVANVDNDAPKNKARLHFESLLCVQKGKEDSNLRSPAGTQSVLV